MLPLCGRGWRFCSLSSDGGANRTNTPHHPSLPHSAVEISAFGVLFVSCLYFLLAFAVMIGVRAFLAGGDWRMFLPSHDPAQNVLLHWPRRGEQWTMAQLLVLIGALGTANSYMNVYATPPTRTPPMVQTVLLNAGEEDRVNGVGKSIDGITDGWCTGCFARADILMLYIWQRTR